VVIGERFSFTVTGDLTVVGESRPETFNLTVTANSPTEISGTGTTVIRYDEYGISIPSVPAVARVDEEVRLELAFVALAAE
jgi:polyisoprenoid-binding protein YceI